MVHICGIMGVVSAEVMTSLWGFKGMLTSVGIITCYVMLCTIFHTEIHDDADIDTYKHLTTYTIVQDTKPQWSLKA